MQWLNKLDQMLDRQVITEVKPISVNLGDNSSPYGKIQPKYHKHKIFSTNEKIISQVHYEKETDHYVGNVESDHNASLVPLKLWKDRDSPNVKLMLFDTKSYKKITPKHKNIPGVSVDLLDHNLFLSGSTLSHKYSHINEIHDNNSLFDKDSVLFFQEEKPDLSKGQEFCLIVHKEFSNEPLKTIQSSKSFCSHVDKNIIRNPPSKNMDSTSPLTDHLDNFTDDLDYLDSEYFDSCKNCHGIVHLRLLQAQNLNCTSGLTIQAIVSLPPWKGKIHWEESISYNGPSQTGVCVCWDNESNIDSINMIKNTINNTNSVKPYHSMVHMYNNEDTPIPSIAIELNYISYMVFETFICSLKLSCKSLMNMPGVWKKYSCSANMTEQYYRKHKMDEKPLNIDGNNHKVSIIILEACFEPTYWKDIPNSATDHCDTVKNLLSIPRLVNHKDLITNRHCKQPASNLSYSVLEESNMKQKSLLQKPLYITKRIISKPHLFRLISSWKPTYCDLCSSLVRWRLKGFRCEVCKLICCTDCQLIVDAEVACGSRAASLAVENASHSTFSLQKLFMIIAPIMKDNNLPEYFEPNNNDDMNKKISFGLESQTNIPKDEIEKDLTTMNEGVGIIKLRILKSYLFTKYFSSDTDNSDIFSNEDSHLFRNGDYYVRISWTGSNETKRTKTVFQTAKPSFESEEMIINIDNYGTEFRIEVFDANTDKAVGIALLTVQGLLQCERDKVAISRPFALSYVTSAHNITFQKRYMTLAVRTGIKSGYGLDYFNSGNKNNSSPIRTSASQMGEISGLVDIEVSIEEFPNLICSNLVPFPERFSGVFHLDTIQLHIARVYALIEDFQKIIDTFIYMISWKSPAVTTISLLALVTFCLNINMEYIGCLPFFIVIIYMFCHWKDRCSSNFQHRWIKRKREGEREMTIKFKGHRSVSVVNVGVAKGKFLKSEHGIPGAIMATISWDPVKCVNGKEKLGIISNDPLAKSTHHIGTTANTIGTSSPVWETIHESDETLRLKHILPNTKLNGVNYTDSSMNALNIGFQDRSDSDEMYIPSINFPILQPIALLGSESLNLDCDILPYENLTTLKWKYSPGAIVIEVRFSNVLSRFTLFEEILGNVVIPVSKLIEEKVIEGWFQLIENCSYDLIKIDDESTSENSQLPMADVERLFEKVSNTKKRDSAIIEPFSNENTAEPRLTKEDIPMIYVRAKLELPIIRESVSEEEKEISIVIAEEMTRTATLSQNHIGRGFIDTSINTLNTVRGVGGNLQNLQNQLGSLLDKIERIRNLFNFSCPKKSSLLYITLLVFCILLAIIPTRLVILGVILVQYFATFINTYDFSMTLNINYDNAIKKEGRNLLKTSIPIWLKNIFVSIPTDEDLRRYYFWESRKVMEQEQEVLARERRKYRLAKLWKARWFGRMEMKICSIEDNSMYNWVNIFAVIIGHRFVWWKNAKEFDEGKFPLGHIEFEGHSGLAGLSPRDLRELDKDLLSKVVSIFGRGKNGQEKLCLLISDETIKGSFKEAVIRSCQYVWSQ